jgi:ABC-2 type transport system permease protein
MTLRYLSTEIRRTFRVPRFFVFSLIMPLALYLLFSSIYRTQAVDGTTVEAWFMVNMSVFGAMGAATSVGGRIAAERASGWTRQLRLTPLTVRSYLAGKAATALAVAIPSLVLLYLAGRLVEHVSLAVGTWAAVFGWTLVGLVPFVALGILLGHALSVDATGPVFGALFTGLALIGGIWFPVSQMPHAMAKIAKASPSYWLGEAGRAPLDGHAIGLHGLLVLAAWTVVFALAATRRYRRGTARA